MVAIEQYVQYPTLSEGERLVRVLTSNPEDDLHAVVDADMTDEELDEELRFSLRRKFGKGLRYCGFEDRTYIYDPFEMSELEALLGDFIGDYDVEGIVDEATRVDVDGNRHWVVFGDDLNAVLERHEL